MDATELRALADALEPMARAPRFEDFDVPAFCAWVRACADAKPVGYATANDTACNNAPVGGQLFALTTPVAMPRPSEPTEAQIEASQAALDVLAERRRQVEAEGWTPAHDDTSISAARWRWPQRATRRIPLSMNASTAQAKTRCHRWQCFSRALKAL